MEKDDEISDSELNQINEFIEKTGEKKVNLRRERKKQSLAEKKQLAKCINNHLNEYINGYILIGFDVNGNDVIIVNSANEMENRALRDIAQDFLLPMEYSRNDRNFDQDFEDEDEE